MVLVGGGGAEGVVEGGGVIERAGAVCFWSMRIIGTGQKGGHVTSCDGHVTCDDHVTLFSCSLRDIAMANWRSSSSCS